MNDHDFSALLLSLCLNQPGDIVITINILFGYDFQHSLKIARAEIPKRYLTESLLKTRTRSFGNEMVKAVDWGI